MLQPGDIIRIVCTARSATAKQLLPATRLLESWGYKVELGKTIGLTHHQYGGTTQDRLDDLQAAIDDPHVAAIWIARGGYGTIHLLEQLEYTAFAKAKNETIIGYSDVTLLHAVLQNLGLKSVHAFMPLEVKHKTPESIESLRLTLAGETHSIVLPNNDSLPNQQIKGIICGGNLSILYSLLGSKDQLLTSGKILFIEEIDEYLYHIERMLYSLKRAGMLTNLRALLVGGMTTLRDHEIPLGKTYQEIINVLTAEFDYPVIYNFPAGHVADHRAIEFGADCIIEIKGDQVSFSKNKA